MISQTRTYETNLNDYQREDVKAFLIFQLNDQLFAVPEEQVAQILPFKQFDTVPGVKKSVIGVIDVRGKIATLLDLKYILRFGSYQDGNNKGDFILLNVIDDQIAMRVDKVVGLKYIAKTMIKEDLDFISSYIKKKYIIGATKVGNDLVVLLNLDLLVPEYDEAAVTESRESRVLAHKKSFLTFIDVETGSEVKESDLVLSSSGILQKGNFQPYVVFQLDEELYAVPEDQVNQILPAQTFDNVPGSEDNVIGVIDVRGKITTLLDLKRILHLGAFNTKKLEGKSAILLNVSEDNIAFLVDRVEGLRYIEKNNIKENLDFISSYIKKKYIIGATNLEERIIVLLNLDLLVPHYKEDVVIQSRKTRKLKRSKEKSDNYKEEDIPVILISEDDFVKYSD